MIVALDSPPEKLTALDATFLELEQADDCAHMHIGAVMLLEPRSSPGAPPIERVREEIRARLGRLPRYEQRLSSPRTGGLSWPSWEPDPDFDISHHVRLEALPEPAGVEQLRAWAGDYYSVRLDRRRPLWELVVVELADGRWALVSKTHHCMVDGVGSVDAAKVLLDTDPNAASPTALPGAGKTEARADRGADREGGWLSIDPREITERSMRVAGRAIQMASGAVAGVASTLGRVSDPHRLAEALRESRAVVEVLIRDELIAAPSSSVNQPIGADRQLAVIEVPLETLKGIRSGLGGTVNDAVLAATTGGLRELLLARGEEPPGRGLRAMVPVSIRPAADRLALGNRITSLFVHLPVAVEDPALRYRSQLEEAEGLKASDQGIGSRGLIDLAALAPPVLHSFLARSLFASRLFNVTITNVPGPQTPLYAIGSEVIEIWPIVPLAADHAIGLAVISYNGSVFFCLNTDRDSLPDLAVLRDAIAAEIESLAELAGQAGAGSGQTPNEATA